VAAVHGMSTRVETSRGGRSPTTSQIVATGFLAPSSPLTRTTTSYNSERRDPRPAHGRPDDAGKQLIMQISPVCLVDSERRGEQPGLVSSARMLRFQRIAHELVRRDDRLVSAWKSRQAGHDAEPTSGPGPDRRRSSSATRQRSSPQTTPDLPPHASRLAADRQVHAASPKPIADRDGRGTPCTLWIRTQIAGRCLGPWLATGARQCQDATFGGSPAQRRRGERHADRAAGPVDGMSRLTQSADEDRRHGIHPACTHQINLMYCPAG